MIISVFDVVNGKLLAAELSIENHSVTMRPDLDSIANACPSFIRWNANGSADLHSGCLL